VGPQVSLDFDKCPTPKSHAAKNVETAFELEVRKIDFPALQPLMNEIETRPRTDVGRPPAVTEVDGQAVGPFQIDSKHISEFAESELHVGAQLEIAIKDRTNPSMQSNQKKLWI
jgi:hypothetical protein